MSNRNSNNPNDGNNFLRGPFRQGQLDFSGMSKTNGPSFLFTLTSHEVQVSRASFISDICIKIARAGNPDSAMKTNGPNAVTRVVFFSEVQNGKSSVFLAALRRQLPDNIKVRVFPLDRLEKVPVRQTDVVLVETLPVNPKQKEALVSMLKSKSFAAYVGLLTRKDQVEPEVIGTPVIRSLKGASRAAGPVVAPCLPMPISAPDSAKSSKLKRGI